MGVYPDHRSGYTHRSHEGSDYSIHLSGCFTYARCLRQPEDEVLLDCPYDLTDRVGVVLSLKSDLLPKQIFIQMNEIPDTNHQVSLTEVRWIPIKSVASLFQIQTAGQRRSG